MYREEQFRLHAAGVYIHNYNDIDWKGAPAVMVDIFCICGVMKC